MCHYQKPEKKTPQLNLKIKNHTLLYKIKRKKMSTNPIDPTIYLPDDSDTVVQQDIESEIKDYIPLSTTDYELLHKDSLIVKDILDHTINSSQDPYSKSSDHLNIIVIKDESSILLESPFQVQGNIVDDDGNTICKGIPISKQVSTLEELQNIYSAGTYLVRPFYEGSLLRVFHYKSRWRIATSRKIDAFHSRWGSLTSFGELFRDYITKILNTTLEGFFDLLKTDFIYYFLFTSQSVFYVHPSTSSHLRLLFVLNANGEKVVDDSITLILDQMVYSDYFEVVSEFLGNQHLGLVLENERERYTLFSADYIENKRLYGSQKILAVRILELKNDPVEALAYQKAFPQAVEYFKRVNSEIDKFCKKVHRTYITRFVQRNFVEVDGPINHFVKLVHKLYLENKRPTYLSNVTQLFLSQPVDVQYLYLKKYLPAEIGGRAEK
jgi:hypothetical protein